MYKADQIVIGGTLSAFLFAYYRNYPLIFTNLNPPTPFDFFEVGVDFSDLYLDSTSFELNTTKEKKILGVSQLDLYDKINPIMTLSGRVLFSHNTGNIHIDKNTMRIVTKNAKTFEVKFRKLYIFDDCNISGLNPPATSKTQLFKVLDWFEVNCGGKHNIEHIYTNDKFVNEIYFYPSSHTPSKKDLVAISYLTQEQMDNYEYSDAYARYKIILELKNAGIKGSKNGKNPNFPEKSNEPYKYLKPKIRAVKRQILPTMDKYTNTKLIEFRYDTAQQIIQNNMADYTSYANKLNILLS